MEAVGFPVQNVYKMTYGDENVIFEPVNGYKEFSFLPKISVTRRIRKAIFQSVISASILESILYPKETLKNLYFLLQCRLTDLVQDIVVRQFHSECLY